jgi:hypothetical protein
MKMYNNQQAAALRVAFNYRQHQTFSQSILKSCHSDVRLLELHCLSMAHTMLRKQGFLQQKRP